MSEASETAGTLKDFWMRFLGTGSKVDLDLPIPVWYEKISLAFDHELADHTKHAMRLIYATAELIDAIQSSSQLTQTSIYFRQFRISQLIIILNAELGMLFPEQAGISGIINVK